MVTPTPGRTKATLGAFDPGLAAEIAASLERSADLTAVERFSQWHAETSSPAHESLYRELLPASPPGPGQQYSFEVDLDKCSSCKACVTACHSLNGLDDGESWRTVGTLLGGPAAGQATVTTSCHHCVEPGCASGCPTLAYEKDALTGIVKHLDDQCMGCQYCQWTCPYDAPKWNDRLGIVRKCDMCHERLAVGEAPACVQACPSQAIRIVTVATGALLADPASGTVLPGISAPESTKPTTVYKGAVPTGARPADADDLVPEHGHTPLAVLLVLTQWSTGLWLLATLRDLATGTSHPWAKPTALVFLLAGLGLGTLHLGRPERAWKAFLGWRRSWFSREVLAFGNAVPLAFAAIVAVPFLPKTLALGLDLATLGFLLAGVACSALLYMVTPRPAWARPATAWRFALTGLGGGAVVLGSLGGEWIRLLGIVSMTTGLAKAYLVLSDKKPALGSHDSLILQSRLLTGPLSGFAKLQFQLFLVAMGMAALGTIFAQPLFFIAAILFQLGSDLIERTLFFRACPATRMPGGAGRD